MMSLMLKLLTIIALSSSFLLSEELDKRVVDFLEKSVVSNENYQFEEITILKTDDVKNAKGWKVYFVRIDLSLLKPEHKKVSINDVVFTNGKLISKDFIDVNSGKSIKNTLEN